MHIINSIPKIECVRAIEILDSRAAPTVRALVALSCRLSWILNDREYARRMRLRVLEKNVYEGTDVVETAVSF